MVTRTQVNGARGFVVGAARNSLMHESMPFTSACPTCGAQHLQRGFSPATVKRLLADGYPIEAYCVLCDKFWPISVRERVDLAKALTTDEDLTGAMDESVLFTSICPNCFREQQQQGYSRSVICSYLEGDHAIEAYCVKCGEVWEISQQERVALGKALLAAGE